VLGALVETEEDRDRRELVDLIRRKGGSVTARDLMRSCRKYATAEDAEGALTDLIGAGMGKWQETGTTDQGGRPAMRFTLVTPVDTDRTPENPDETEVLSASAGPAGQNEAERAPEGSDVWGAV
jgi:hypothetical protein